MRGDFLQSQPWSWCDANRQKGTTVLVQQRAAPTVAHTHLRHGHGMAWYTYGHGMVHGQHQHEPVGALRETGACPQFKQGALHGMPGMVWYGMERYALTMNRVGTTCRPSRDFLTLNEYCREH